MLMGIRNLYLRVKKTLWVLFLPLYTDFDSEFIF
jgi:hypothetical protein